MRIAAAVELSPEQRHALEKMARGRSLPARVVERARVVAAGCRRTGEQADCAADEHYAGEGSTLAEPLSHGRHRGFGKGRATPTITERRVKRVVNRTLHDKPANATHWSTRTTARAARASAKPVCAVSGALTD